MRDQQVQEYQQKIEELSRQHEAAIDEKNTLQQQTESLNKLAKYYIACYHGNSMFVVIGAHRMKIR